MSLKLAKLFYSLNRIRALLYAIFLEIFPRQVIRFLKQGTMNVESNLTCNIPDVCNFETNSKTRRGNLVLLDSFSIPHWALINTIVARHIAKNTSSTVVTFNFLGRNFSENTLYKSLGIIGHLQIRLNPISFLKVFATYIIICHKIHSGTKIIDLNVYKINIGIDVYESYLRRGHPTLDSHSPDFYRELWRAIKQCIFFSPLFIKKKISAVLVSHDNYVGPGLLSKMAFRYAVPVILANPFEINILNEPFQLYKRFARYNVYFSSQSYDWQEKWLHRAKIELQSRLKGEIGVGTMTYQKASSFTSHRIEKQIVKNQNKKLLILSHDFFDNPHAYSKMLFDDFIDWMTFVANCCRENGIDCYIKLHRDFSDIEYRIVLDFQKKNPHCMIVNPEVSYHQLFDEGIRFVTTCYGSAGHELPLLGFTVINSSYNPHIAFSFNHHASTKEEYYYLLKRQIPIVIDQKLELEIYKFYAVHSFLMWPDSYNMDSFSNYNSACDSDFTKQKALRYLENHFARINNLVNINFLDALFSKRVFSVEKSLPNELQFRYLNDASYESFFGKFK